MSFFGKFTCLVCRIFCIHFWNRKNVESDAFCCHVEVWAVQTYVKLKSCRSRQELSNEYLLAKIDVDTADNKPLQSLEVIWFFRSFASSILTAMLARPVSPGPIHGRRNDFSNSYNIFSAEAFVRIAWLTVRDRCRHVVECSEDGWEASLSICAAKSTMNLRLFRFDPQTMHSSVPPPPPGIAIGYIVFQKI